MAVAVSALNFVKLSYAACAVDTATLKQARVITYRPCFMFDQIESAHRVQVIDEMAKMASVVLFAISTATPHFLKC